MDMLEYAHVASHLRKRGSETMSDGLKGGLYIGVWFLLFWIGDQIIAKPASTGVAIFLAVGTFVGSVLIVNVIDKANSPRATRPLPPYPEDWSELRQAALARDNYRCGNCGSTVGLMVHHIVPLSKGGANSLSNLRTLCEDCHKKLHPHMR